MAFSPSTNAEIKAFIDKHRALLARERNVEIERNSLLLSNCGPKLLEQKGLSLNGLSIMNISLGLGGKTLVELERATAYHTSPLFPSHTFRPGDLARIEANVASSATTSKRSVVKKGKSGEGQSRTGEGIVYKVSDTRIVIAIEQNDNTEDMDFPERCRVLKLANSVTYDRMDKALEDLERISLRSPDKKEGTPFELTPLNRVLLGISQPSKHTLESAIQFFDTSLNDSQKEAVKFALCAPEVACIHGPPGTGKTHTLIEIILQLILKTESNSEPKRLLVCGASNLSVDNILERLLALPPDDRRPKLIVTRIGHPARVMAKEGILDATLELKASRSEQAALAKDVKNEIETTMELLSGKGNKGKRPRGLERKKMWEDVKALRKEYRQREGGIVKSVLSDSQVILATCHSAGNRQLRNIKFDAVIIDEATQALEAVCWVPIFKASKLILAGDPMQLPPTVLSVGSHDKSTAKTPTASPPSKLQLPTQASDKDSEVGRSDEESGESESELETKAVSPPAVKHSKRRLRPPSSLEVTLFDRLEKMYGPDIKRMLNVQYRMNERICKFPSKTLYGSKLKSHDSVAHHLLKDISRIQLNDKDEETEVLGTPVVFFDTAGCEYFERLDGDNDEGSRCNENEAAVVKTWVDKLIATGILPSQIAVITPYQAQVVLLTTLLRPQYGVELEIGTVDGMQGREKEAIIISLVRSNDSREVGFLKEKRRMNVAMTRARRHLCVVGDSSTVVHGGPYMKKWIAWLEANADVRYAGLE